jgi:cell division septation protein DedD
VINLICDRALQRGHRARATLVESSLIQEAVTSLGIDAPAPAPAVVVTRVEKPVETKATAAVDIFKKAAVPVSPLAGSPQILSEFAAEADLAVSSSDTPYGRMAAAVLIGAVLVGISAAAWFFYATTGALEVTAAALPARPAWTSATHASPSTEALTRGLASSDSPASVRAANDGSHAIQVASFASRSRADRLVAELARAGFRARIVEFNLGSREGIVRQIRVDGYQSAEEAERDLARIRELPGYGDAHLLPN